VPHTKEIEPPTHPFARAFGPWLILVAGIVAMRAPDISTLASGAVDGSVFTWLGGALMLLGGLLIIAFYQYWSSLAAFPILLFGWLLALRGLALMATPQMSERAVSPSPEATLYVWPACGLVVAVGISLTYAGWIARPAVSLKH
jgi:hypothetical protein